MPSNAINRANEELEMKYAELQNMLRSAPKAEKDYITKDPSQRDQYDIAFGKLNPESRAKAERYGNLIGEIQTLNNNIVNLESAKNFFSNLYNQQRQQFNSGFDKLQQSNALSNDIALASALSTAGGMGASGVQSAGLKAQANNMLAATQQKAEADRLAQLAAITQAQAQVPLQLSNMGQINASIAQMQQPQPTAAYRGGGGGGRVRPPKDLPPSQNNDQSEYTKEDIEKFTQAGLEYDPENKVWFESSTKIFVNPFDYIKVKKEEQTPDLKEGYYFDKNGKPQYGIPENHANLKFFPKGTLSLGGWFGNTNKADIWLEDYPAKIKEIQDNKEKAWETRGTFRWDDDTIRAENMHNKFVVEEGSTESEGSEKIGILNQENNKRIRKTLGG